MNNFDKINIDHIAVTCKKCQLNLIYSATYMRWACPQGCFTGNFSQKEYDKKLDVLKAQFRKEKGGGFTHTPAGIPMPEPEPIPVFVSLEDKELRTKTMELFVGFCISRGGAIHDGADVRATVKGANAVCDDFDKRFRKVEND